MAASHIKKAVEILDERCKTVAVEEKKKIYNPRNLW